jgi:hypothetical protein
MRATPSFRRTSQEVGSLQAIEDLFISNKHLLQCSKISRFQLELPEKSWSYTYIYCKRMDSQTRFPSTPWQELHWACWNTTLSRTFETLWE